jgi:murein DD-endopeptidase MepM/ murein hydrolase activator NlpD
MTIDRLDYQVAFSMMVEPDQVLEGTGTVSGTEMTLQAEDPEMGDITLQLSFAPDGQSFTGTYIVESNGVIESGPFNGTLGECEFYGPPGDIEMITPYRSEQDVAAVTGGYSTTDQCPWERIHNGIDIAPRADLMEFQAVAAGKVMRISKLFNDGNGFYQVNVSIKYNSNFEVEYAFEPMSSEEVHGDQQMALIQEQIAVEEEVVQGQVIGKLLSRHNDAAHVHFGMYKNRESACPESYFTQETRQSIIDLLQIWWPTADRICYE